MSASPEELQRAAAAFVLRPEGKVLIGHCKDCRFGGDVDEENRWCMNGESPLCLHRVPDTFGCVHFQERET